VSERLTILGLGVLVLYLLFVIALWLAGRRASVRALAGFVPDCVVLFGRLMSDPRVARRHKLLLGGLGLYLASPIDLVPDFVPVAGQIDDAIIAGVSLRLVLRASGPGLIEEHWPGPPSPLAVVLKLAGQSVQPAERDDVEAARGAPVTGSLES
jgi:uncharacterized membrane protein YkvA (DUF1232 family)